MSTPSNSGRRKRRWRAPARDSILFLAGLALTLNEALFRTGPERPTLYVLFAAMMGLPFVLQARDAAAREVEK